MDTPMTRSWRRCQSAVLFACATGLLIAGPATARTAAAVRTRTIVWLERNQRSDGAWDTGYASQRPLATAEALLALSKASRGTQVTSRRAVGWLRTRELASIDYRGRRLRALVAAGETETSEAASIAALRNGTLGWGLVGPIGPGSYDTALALGAIGPSGLLTTTDLNALVAMVLAQRRFDGGWSGDGMPSSDGPSDLTTTAEITRALAGVVNTALMTTTYALLEANPSSTTPSSLEIAARLAALYGHGRNNGATAALEAELLRDGRFLVGDDLWLSPNAHLYAIGLLAITTRPGVTFTNPAVEADLDRDGSPDVFDLDRDGDGVVVGDLFPANPAESFDSDSDGQGDTADLDDDGDGVADSTEISFLMNSLDPDTDRDGFVDGLDGVVPVARVANAWDLQPNGYVDGEQVPETNPLDPTDHPGKPGDMAPLGLPNGRIDAADTLVARRAEADPQLMAGLAGQRRTIAEQARDADGDGDFDGADVLWLVRGLKAALLNP